MELEHKEFLKEHYNNYETAQSGYVRNLDLPILRKYENIYKTYIDNGFVLTIWCGACRMDMIMRLYTYYNNLDNTDTVITSMEIVSESDFNQQANEINETTAIDNQPKKRGRKPKVSE